MCWYITKIVHFYNQQSDFMFEQLFPKLSVMRQDFFTSVCSHIKPKGYDLCLTREMGRKARLML